MARRGPWIQDPDFEHVDRWTHSSGDNSVRRAPVLVANGIFSNSFKYAEEIDYFPAWSPVPDGNMMELLANAQASNLLNRDSIASNPVTRTTRLTRLHIAGTFGEADWGDGGQATINRFPYYVPLGFRATGALGWMPFAYAPGEWPAGAVAIEFEDGNVAEWLTATMLATTQLRSDAIDNSGRMGETIQSPATTTIYTQTVAQFNAADGPTEEPVDNAMVSLVNFNDPAVVGQTVVPLGTDIDLTSTMGVNGCVITTMTDNFIAPRRTDAPTIPEPSNYWEYGFYIERLDIGWTLRPPRYRWVYDTEPIRRTFPRDDALAGGAAQTWPPPTSLQQSNRTFGGYL